MRNQLIILVVEDEDGHYWLLEKALRRQEISAPIVRFEDGREILDYLNVAALLASDYQFMVLLDLHLPQVSGYEVLKSIRQMHSESMRSMPIFVVTSSDDPEEMQQCYKLGCNAYITKPPDPLYLSGLIRQQLADTGKPSAHAGFAITS